MSIHAIHSSPVAYVPPTAASGAVLGTPPAGGPTQAASTDGSSKTFTGEGPIYSSLKSSLIAAGFTQPDSSADPAAAHANAHAFTHAFFQAVHDQKAADIADGTAQKGDHVTNMQMAIAQLQSQAAAGNAPADLQAAFDTLQQAQPAGSTASTATLASVLAGVSAGSAAMPSNSGAVIDMLA